MKPKLKDVQNDLGAMEIDAKRADVIGGGADQSPSTPVAAVPANSEVMARRALSAPTYSPAPLGFALTGFLLVASILTEGLVNLGNLIVYFVIRKRVQTSCRRVILGAVPDNTLPDSTEDFRGGNPEAPNSPLRLGRFLVLSIAILGCTSCASIERDIEGTAWTLGALTDTTGDLESLSDSLMLLVEVEPIDETIWSLDGLTGVTSVKEDSYSLIWTLQQLFSWESDKYAVWETITLLGG